MKTAIAVVALVGLPLVTATGNRPPLPPCPEEYKPFISQGCFADEDSTALLYRSGLDQTQMTIEKCTAECKGNGFRFAGLKYYGVCYCGSNIDAPEAPDTECSQPCSGDNSQICGSDNFLSVYEDPTFPKTPEEVSVEDYQSLGCYTDDSDVGRAIGFPVNLDAETFTTEKCIDACRERGFPFAGTEYGSECWCGALLAGDSKQVDASECSISCPGEPSETCGGHSRLNLYFASGLVSTEPCGHDTPEPPVSSSTVVSSSIPTSAASSTEHVTTPPPSITTTEKPTSTKSVPLCTATEIIPPKCEFECGKWCAPPLPDWTDKKECYGAAKTCALQVASCFKHAGWPSVVECFDFWKWCKKVTDCCQDDQSKKECWDKHNPGDGNPPTTSTTVYPCPTSTLHTVTTTQPPPTSSSCPPEPTNICTQPSSKKFGYGPGKPVAGIELPVVSCNDIKDDWKDNPFKYYDDADSRKCRSFDWHHRPNVCQDACKDQYEECRETYVKSCGNLSWKGKGRHNHRHKRDDDSDEELERRHWGSGGDHGWWGGDDGDDDRDYSSCAVKDHWSDWAKDGSDAMKCWGRGANNPWIAEIRCYAQYKDCLVTNKRVDPGDSCKDWCKE